METGPNEAVATLPALSVQLPLTDCPTPSCESVTGAENDATPASASVHANVAVTGCVASAPGTYGEPSALANVAVSTGAVRSTSIEPTLSVVELPAKSMQKPLAVWSRPSVGTITGELNEATSDPASRQSKVTVTAWFVQLPRK